MKPRLKSADLTQDDWLVWLPARHGFHEIPWLQLIDAYEAADRRDADLMYQAVLLCQSIERYVRPSMAQDAGFAYRYHRALYLRFLAHGKRPRFLISDVT